MKYHLKNDTKLEQIMKPKSAATKEINEDKTPGKKRSLYRKTKLQKEVLWELYNQLNGVPPKRAE